MVPSMTEITSSRLRFGVQPPIADVVEGPKALLAVGCMMLVLLALLR